MGARRRTRGTGACPVVGGYAVRGMACHCRSGGCSFHASWEVGCPGHAAGFRRPGALPWADAVPPAGNRDFDFGIDPFARVQQRENAKVTDCEDARTPEVEVVAPTPARFRHALSFPEASFSRRTKGLSLCRGHGAQAKDLSRCSSAPGGQETCPFVATPLSFRSAAGCARYGRGATIRQGARAPARIWRRGIRRLRRTKGLSLCRGHGAQAKDLSRCSSAPGGQETCPFVATPLSFRSATECERYGRGTTICQGARAPVRIWRRGIRSLPSAQKRRMGGMTNPMQQ